ncbi:Os07g0450733 [Oryza sativa Japonica Group]|uniref:Os07g0450733 protein n=2 Tax=Oryza sativa subsp. japonica TaxID=39947 RepID=Q7EYU8_ORYSJ|nr:hypothetical protein [Oryza sativa Japonica Group]BAT01314.1 Os07g0450733 [Oryza sativa Japonica Group]
MSLKPNPWPRNVSNLLLPFLCHVLGHKDLMDLSAWFACSSTARTFQGQERFAQGAKLNTECLGRRGFGWTGWDSGSFSSSSPTTTRGGWIQSRRRGGSKVKAVASAAFSAYQLHRC